MLNHQLNYQVPTCRRATILCASKLLCAATIKDKISFHCLWRSCDNGVISGKHYSRQKSVCDRRARLLHRPPLVFEAGGDFFCAHASVAVSWTSDAIPVTLSTSEVRVGVASPDFARNSEGYAAGNPPAHFRGWHLYPPPTSTPVKRRQGASRRQEEEEEEQEREIEQEQAHDYAL